MTVASSTTHPTVARPTPYITDWIESESQRASRGWPRGVKRVPYERALHASTTHRHDYLEAYVGDLGNVVDMDAIRGSKISLGVDPLGGAGVHYWGRIAERYGLDLVVVSETVDPTFRFMTVDWDGQIRMDPSSPYAMQRLIGLQNRFGVAFACDTDHDRHGVVTRSAGLMPPNHYLSVAISYLFEHRPKWSQAAAVGKTMVSSHDRPRGGQGRPEALRGARRLQMVCGRLAPWVARLRRGGERGRLLPPDGWRCLDDGQGWNCPGPLVGEITERTGRDPGELYRELTRELGEPVYHRMEAKATLAQKTRLASLSPRQIRSAHLAGEKIQSILTHAPGNGAPFGGVKVIAEKRLVCRASLRAPRTSTRSTGRASGDRIICAGSSRKLRPSWTR